MGGALGHHGDMTLATISAIHRRLTPFWMPVEIADLGIKAGSQTRGRSAFEKG